MTGMIGMPGSAGAWAGGAVTELATCVLAPNPGPMTLDGTNTWVVGRPGSRTVTVIDPGPDEVDHWNAVAAEVERRDAQIEEILLTHGHDDHSAGARLFAQRAGCSVRALDPAHRLGSEGLSDGDVLELGEVQVRVIATPGHTSDSLSFVLADEGSLLTGDTVLGRGTTVVAHPDGQLSSYLDSLLRLRQEVSDSELTMILPGHGPSLADPAAVIDAYLAHREQRLDQVRDALVRFAAQADTGSNPDEERLAWWVVQDVYADVPRSVWPAAFLSVRAQLSYLRS